MNTSLQRLPRLRWSWLLGGAVCVLLAWVAIMEAWLAARGFMPSVHDTAAVWSLERDRVDRLGERGLALVGASRILLDTDVATLRQASGLEPVQLGIEGGSFLPVLAGLAADPRFHGTVLVDLDVEQVGGTSSSDYGYTYERWYEQNSRRLLPDFDISEERLGTWLHGRLRSYGQGARPWTVLTKRLLTGRDLIQYLHTLPDRETLADYSLLPMPYFRFFRAFRNLDGSLPPGGLTDAQTDALLRQAIATLKPRDNQAFLHNLPFVAAMVHAIQARGGRVLFMAFPTSGYVKAMDDRRYPRTLFWDRFAAAVPAPTVNSEDVPIMASLVCPDGSHLDFRDRERFTAALASTLHLDAHAP